MDGSEHIRSTQRIPSGTLGTAAFVRLCLGFVGGWWLLQLALLGTGLLAIDRVQSQLAAERMADMAAILRLALDQPGTTPAAARFSAQAAVALQADPMLAAIVLLDKKGKLLGRAGAGEGTAVPADAQRLPMAGGATLILARHPPVGLAEEWRGRLPLLGAAMAIPLVHLAVALWLRRKVAGQRKLAWLAVNGATGMLTSLLLLGWLLAAGYGNATVKSAAVDQSLTVVVQEHLAQPKLDHRQLNRQLAGYQALDSRMERIDLSFTLGSGLSGSPRVWEQMRRIPLEGDKTLSVIRHWPPVEATPALILGLKNIAVLIVATALLCAVFAGTGAGFKLPMAALARRGGPGSAVDGEAVLEAIRPLYFLAVFAENLCAPFLPRLLNDAVAQAHLPPNVASALFMAYFFAFTAVLLPAGWLQGRFGAGGLIKAGAALLGVGLALPALSLAAPALMGARLLSGAGQGVLLIGVQSLVLAHTHAQRRTAGTSIIVFGFNGGMVGGNAFGSLLVERFGPQAVFATAGLSAALVALAAIMLLAGKQMVEEGAPRGPHRRFDWVGLRCLANPGYLITTLCIGIPTKAVLTGVVLFALPLILGHRGFTLEEIGQIAMFYAAGVLMATAVVSRVSRQKRTGQMLIAGALLSAVGMAATRLADHPVLAGGPGETVLLIACILLLGMAHGCINAPVVAHVADLPIAHRLGSVRVAAAYRLVERVGHIGGPLVVERCLSAVGEKDALTWIAVAVAAAALVFLVQNARRRDLAC